MATIPAPKTLVPTIDEVKQRFHRLEAQWKAETLVLSDPSKIMGHPAMRAIIAMGEDVVPFILRDLQEQPSLLVWALPEIAGENLAPPRTEDGFRKWNVDTQTEIWLQWGRKRAWYEQAPSVPFSGIANNALSSHQSCRR